MPFKADSHGPEELIAAESLVIDPSSAADVLGEETLPAMMTNIDWSKAQRSDPSTSRVMFLLERGSRPAPREITVESPEVKLLLKEWKKLVLTDGVCTGNILIKTTLCTR